MWKTTLLLLALLLSLGLGGCGGEEPSEEAAPPAAEAPTPEPLATEAPTPEPPPATGTPLPAESTATPVAEATAAPVAETQSQLVAITVGVNAEFEPFVYVDDAGNLAGFDIDIMNALAAAGGFEMAYVRTPFDAIFDSLEAGEFDAAISAITITDERRQKVDFTDTYFATAQMPMTYLASGQGIATKTENMEIDGPEDLTSEVAVGVKRGTTGARFVADNTDAQVAVFLEAQPALQAVADGQVDAAVVDIPVIISYIKENPEASLKIAAGPLTSEEYGIAVRKDRPDVLAVLNRTLTQIRENGTYDAIFRKWFGSP